MSRSILGIYLLSQMVHNSINAGVSLFVIKDIFYCYYLLLLALAQFLSFIFISKTFSTFAFSSKFN
jgi:hypothetical protein